MDPSRTQPSGGLVIDFECPTCGGPVVQLAFAQDDKDRTLVSWRFVSDMPCQ
jgi:hypothetical protein